MQDRGIPVFRYAIHHKHQTMLSSVKSSPYRPLFAVRYGVDFFLLRNRSIGDKSHFIYASSNGNGGGYGSPHDHLGLGPVRRARGWDTFATTIMGEVDRLSQLTLVEPHRVAATCLTIRRPQKATCEAQRIYTDQLRELRYILEADAADEGGTAVHSWFGPNRDGNTEGDCVSILINPRAAFAVRCALALIPGEPVELFCKLQRIDEEAPGLQRNYQLWATSISVWPQDSLQLTDSGNHVCDNTAPPCQFC